MFGRQFLQLRDKKRRGQKPQQNERVVQTAVRYWQESKGLNTVIAATLLQIAVSSPVCGNRRLTLHPPPSPTPLPRPSLPLALRPVPSSTLDLWLAWKTGRLFFPRG